MTRKAQISLWLAVAIKLGFSLYTGGAFASVDVELNNPTSTAMDIGGSLAYDYDPVSVEYFAKWAKLSIGDAKEVSEEEPYLLQKEAIESVNGFNPFKCKKCSVKTLSELHDGRFTEDQAFKWFRYRRAEIGECFEDEVYNPYTKRCVLISDLPNLELERH